MTAPVIAAPTRSEKIEMTVPVTAVPTATGGYVIAFVLPKRFTLETAPQPTDQRVKIRRIEGHVLAVRRYSGRSGEDGINENAKLLLQALPSTKFQQIGEPISALYDAPFKPWFMRRNEVAVLVETRK